MKKTVIFLLSIYSSIALSDVFIAVDDNSWVRYEEYSGVKKKLPKRPFLAFMSKDKAVKVTLGREYFSLNDTRCYPSENFAYFGSYQMSNMTNECNSTTMPILFGEVLPMMSKVGQKSDSDVYSEASKETNLRIKNKEEISYRFSPSDVEGVLPDSLKLKFSVGEKEVTPQFPFEGKILLTLGRDVLRKRARRLLKREPELVTYLNKLSEASKKMIPEVFGYHLDSLCTTGCRFEDNARVYLTGEDGEDGEGFRENFVMDIASNLQSSTDPVETYLIYGAGGEVGLSNDFDGGFILFKKRKGKWGISLISWYAKDIKMSDVAFDWK